MNKHLFFLILCIIINIVHFSFFSVENNIGFSFDTNLYTADSGESFFSLSRRIKAQSGEAAGVRRGPTKNLLKYDATLGGRFLRLAVKKKKKQKQKI